MNHQFSKRTFSLGQSETFSKFKLTQGNNAMGRQALEL
jgi:hypothetical protein